MNADAANALIATGLLAFAIWAIRYSVRQARPRIPAAPDNRPGADTDALPARKENPQP